MNIQEIVTAYLIEHGHDGLCGDECGCELADLFPCGEDFSRCVLGRKMPCPPECGDHNFHIVPDDDKETIEKAQATPEKDTNIAEKGEGHVVQ